MLLGLLVICITRHNPGRVYTPAVQGCISASCRPQSYGLYVRVWTPFSKPGKPKKEKKRAPIFEYMVLLASGFDSLHRIIVKSRARCLPMCKVFGSAYSKFFPLDTRA